MTKEEEKTALLDRIASLAQLRNIYMEAEEYLAADRVSKMIDELVEQLKKL